MLIIRKSTFCQKVTSTLASKILFISSLKKPGCDSKQDLLELTTLRCDEPYNTSQVNLVPNQNHWARHMQELDFLRLHISTPCCICEN